MIRSVLVCVLAIAATGCDPAASSDERTGQPESSSNAEVSGSSSSGSCAFIVEYVGSTYLGTGVRVSPVEGRPLGRVTLPACDDTGDAGGGESGEEIEIAEVEGVSPSLAVAWRGHPDSVLIREGADRAEFPPELERLLRTPECDPDDEPIELAGPWLGILGTDGTDELGPPTPYAVEIYVERSSAPRYERAYLTVRVPGELDRPLTREDIRKSLWEGGTLSLTIDCRDGRYFAEDLEAHAPGQ